ncbi:MAG: hypothetical protein JWM56_731 [Candidatus Peribacteria bacterium]|nr:hypothetical protein [Candidatus Peribacteria bacterium]
MHFSPTEAQESEGGNYRCNIIKKKNNYAHFTEKASTSTYKRRAELLSAVAKRRRLDRCNIIKKKNSTEARTPSTISCAPFEAGKR